VPLVVLLTVAGDHVPSIPFNDVKGNTGAILPTQKGDIGLNVGVTKGVTVIGIGIGVVIAHCPVFAVKV